MNGSTDSNGTLTDKGNDESVLSRTTLRPKTNPNAIHTVVNTNMYQEFINVFADFVIPSISVFGLVGNVCAIIILSRRQGLGKSANILLVALNMADVLWLLHYVSVPKILFYAGPGFRFSNLTNEVLFWLYQFTFVLHYAGHSCSTTLPAVITVERLIAVFFPLHFPRLVTPLRTWLAVGFVYVVSSGRALYVALLFRLINIPVVFNGKLINLGLITESSFGTQQYNSGMLAILEEVFKHVFITSPHPLTLVGSILIGIKVSITARRRQGMTQSMKAASSQRTTTALLAVCLIYAISGSFVIFFIDMGISIRHVEWRMLLDEVSILIQSVNSSTNFIVYMVIQKYFWKEFKDLFTCKMCRKGPSAKR